MHLLAIDPGPERSAWVILDDVGCVLSSGITENCGLRPMLHGIEADHLVMEMPKARGQLAGDTLFATCRWIGRFEELWMGFESVGAASVSLVARQDIVYHFCGARNVRSADAALRQILIDRYGPGTDKAIGVKKHPGPLYGVKKDIWQALAVGVYLLEVWREGRHV